VQQASSTSEMLNSIKKVAETEKQMAARSSTSASDMEMIRRLKRLEKFELQQSLKAKIKPKLLSNTTESASGTF
jgi:hypothetical protein